MNEQIARVISGAISAAGPMGGNQYDWEQRVIAAMPIVATLFDEEGPVGRRAKWFDEAHIYDGWFMDWRLEESSQRVILRTDARKQKKQRGSDQMVDVIDEIRTDRVDSTLGARIFGLIKSFKPGDRLLMWRVNEPMRDDPESNVRVLYHVKRIGRAEPAGSAGTQPAGRSASPRADPATPPPTPKGGGVAVKELLAQIPKLPPATRQTLIKTARDRSVAISSGMSEEDAHAVLLMLSHIERDRGEEPF